MKVIDTNFLGLDIKTSKKVKSPETLANEALDLFTQAEAKMDDAQAEIQKQIDEDAAKIAELTNKIGTATSAIDRLNRVKQRIANLVG